MPFQRSATRRQRPIGPDDSRNPRRRPLHGLTVAAQDELWRLQGGRCALCGAQLDLVSRRLDHDHRTGMARGWLCNTENAALGAFGDDPARLRRAADWVERGGLLR